MTGRIGRGGMGMVYRGLDEALEREVAVKTLTIEGTLDEESRQRFEIEAKAAAKLQHPNIITVFELGEDRGVPFIAMEMLPGVDLESLVRSGEEMLLEEKLDIVIQVARGLAYAHEHRIVHRDIKPSNIRLLDDGTVKIMDFGIAKLGGTQLTKTGMMVGTVHYMSPEQIRGKPLDGRSDVFSRGRDPLRAARGPAALQGRRGPPRSSSRSSTTTRLPSIPDAGRGEPRLQEIVSRALAKNPDARYPTAAAFADDLALVLEDHRARSRIPRHLASEPRIDRGRAAAAEGRPGSGGRDPPARDRGREAPLGRGAAGAADGLREAQQRHERPAEPEVEDFPELEATFKASPTRRAADTRCSPRSSTRRPGASRPAPRPLGPRGAAARGSRFEERASSRWSRPSSLVLGTAESRRPADLRVPVRSHPIGAAVLVDGKDTGVVTNGELVLSHPCRGAGLTFRKQGYRDDARTVGCPCPPATVSLTLTAESASLPVTSDPPGATVSLDGQRVKGVTPLELALDPGQPHVLAIALEGHATQEVRLVPGRRPAEVRVKLEPAGPLGDGDRGVELSPRRPLAWPRARQGPGLAPRLAARRPTDPEPRLAGLFLRRNLTVVGERRRRSRSRRRASASSTSARSRTTARSSSTAPSWTILPSSTSRSRRAPTR